MGTWSLQLFDAWKYKMKIALISPLILLLAGVAHGSESRDDSDWPTYANNPGSSKYAPLAQIDRSNVADLEVAWSWDAPDNELLATNKELSTLGLKSTPLKIGNVLFINTSLGFVAALDARTGAELWVFDTRTYEDGRPANMGFNSRGVSYWEQGDKRRILLGTNNAYLWSLDADTGLPDPTFGDGGRIDLTQGLGRDVDRSMYSVVAAPMVVPRAAMAAAATRPWPATTPAAAY